MKPGLDLKNEYEKILLVVFALVAAAAAFLLHFASVEARENARLAPAKESGKAFSANTLSAALDEDVKSLQEKRLWRESEASPFVSRVYLPKDGSLVDIREPGNDLYEGIPNAWLIDNGFEGELADDLPDRDTDADGFSNREEFMAKTNPRDNASMPEEWTKLRLGDVRIEQLQIIFTSKDYKGRASINSVAASADNLRGEPIGPTTEYTPNDPATPALKVRRFKAGFQTKFDEEEIPFKLIGFREEMRANPTITLPDGRPQMDRIEFAILESTSGDGTKIELEAGKAETSPYSLAQLIDIRPGGQPQEVRIGASFKLDPSGRYKLVDVSEENATIQDLDSGEKHVIPKTAAPVPQATSEEAQPQ